MELNLLTEDNLPYYHLAIWETFGGEGAWGEWVRRWTVLAGLKDESSSRLLCRLHTRNPNRDVAELEVQIKPGTLVIFNGDKVYHAVSPLKKGESRYVVSMQYVTIGEMNPFMRFISNMKDAVAYFGLRGVFGKGKVR